MLFYLSKHPQRYRKALGRVRLNHKTAELRRVGVGTKRILVVEDNRDNMTLIVDVLSALDYGTLQALDGEQGVAMAKQERPDLILMDSSLPRMDGWTATRLIKADETLKHIPIIALTAHAMIGDREKAIEAGCNDYISKPISLQELASKLREYVG